MLHLVGCEMHCWAIPCKAAVSQNPGVNRGSMSVSNRIFESWSKILRISQAMVSARYSARINVKCVAVWITFPLSALGSRSVARIWKYWLSRSLSTCLLSPPSRIVSCANGQLRSKWTNSHNFAWPSLNMMPGASSLVTPLAHCLVSMS